MNTYDDVVFLLQFLLHHETAYARQRTNARILSSNRIGRVNTPCEIGSRWHRYAFTIRDQYEKIIVAQHSGEVLGF
jgi:hypothetical protein